MRSSANASALGGRVLMHPPRAVRSSASGPRFDAPILADACVERRLHKEPFSLGPCTLRISSFKVPVCVPNLDEQLPPLVSHYATHPVLRVPADCTRISDGSAQLRVPALLLVALPLLAICFLIAYTSILPVSIPSSALWSCRDAIILLD